MSLPGTSPGHPAAIGPKNTVALPVSGYDFTGSAALGGRLTVTWLTTRFWHCRSISLRCAAYFSLD
ncbi:MAG TPA: hypothetical protein VGY77_09115 [Gemmataceae bacterium]|nr:hypothetical protein [Gemmataceae bacterium]